MITIGIIDSGIDNNILIKNGNIQGIHIFKSDNKIYIDNNLNDEIGHGTAVYDIINQSNNSDEIEYFILKIFDGNNIEIDEDVLIYAFEYIINNNIPCDLINASLGLAIVNEKQKLWELCETLRNRDVIIVSAFDNDGTIVFPAAFNNVIGVTTADNIYSKDQFNYINNNMVNIAAFGNCQRIRWADNRIILNGGDSFACAHISRIASKILLNNKLGYEDMLAELRKLASVCVETSISNTVIRNKINYKMDRVIIFPFAKEEHSLVRYQHLLPFSIVDIYEVPKSGKVGTDTNALLNIDSKNYTIKNINQLQIDTFDTIILGHTYELTSTKFAFNIYSLIEKLHIAGKNIYSFDDLSIIYPDLPKIEKEKIFTPKAEWNDYTYAPFGKLYKYSKPILGILGTCSKQGKFSLQLILRDLFMKNGYKVAQLGSEPSAYLFGMDACIPFGHDSTLSLTGRQLIQYINKVIYNLCEEDNDIIICGSQSGTVTYDFGNIYNYPVDQIDFLLATNPDAIVLCVNPFDDISYIERNIRFIESCSESIVIAICVYPLDWKNQESGIFSTLMPLDKQKYAKMKDEIESKLKKPVVLLGENIDMDTLYHCIIKFFSNE